MYGEIITIGDELISGRVADLNAWYAAGRLTATGLRVTVSPQWEMTRRAFPRPAKSPGRLSVRDHHRSLGSTDDDITNEIAAYALNRPLCLDEEMYEQIKDYVALRGLKMSRAFEKMAWMPEDAKILCPRRTSAVSLLLKQGPPLLPPGVPEQMRYLMDEVVIPDLLLQCTVLRP